MKDNSRFNVSDRYIDICTVLNVVDTYIHIGIVPLTFMYVSAW